MAAIAPKTLTPCLWFDSEAEEAANFYVTVFADSRVMGITRYGTEGKEIHGQEAGKVMMVDFELGGQRFVALNGGPIFKFTEAVSFQIPCETQAEIDYFWDKLIADGGEESHCGWLKDRFGLSWQVVPSMLVDMLNGPDAAQVNRVTKALLQMNKLDIAALRRAAAGAAA